MKKIQNNDTRTTEMITISRAEYDSLNARIDKLNARIDWLTEQLVLAQKRQFGRSSEKSDEVTLNQMSLLFNEPEICDDAAEPEEEKTTVPSYQRRKKQSGSARDVLPANTEVEVVEHRLSEEERICPQCGDAMREIGTETVETIKFYPARAVLVRDVYYTYACKRCEKEDISTPIVKTPHKKAVIPGSFASAEAAAWLMNEKFVMHSPLYRIEQDLNRKGIRLSRQTMSNWLIRCAKDWLKPVYDELKKELVRHDIINADETTVQVLHEPGKKPDSESYMWLYRTGADAEHPIVLYEYRDNRRQENPGAFLKGFRGYLQTDGYSGYNSVENVTHVGCWAHARRKFNDAYEALPKSKKQGAAVEGLAYCTKLFDIERKLADMTPDERYKERLEQEKPVLDDLLAWTKTRNAAPKSKLGIALTYLKNQWASLTNYLLDGRLEISNNRAERSIKPFVMGRKNWLFANTTSGADSSAVIFSLVETAKENGLDPFKYLAYVLKTAPNLDQSQDGWATPLLPQNVPDDCG